MPLKVMPSMVSSAWVASIGWVTDKSLVDSVNTPSASEVSLSLAASSTASEGQALCPGQTFVNGEAERASK